MLYFFMLYFFMLYFFMIMFFHIVLFTYLFPGFILERTGMVKQIHLLFRKLMKSKSVYGKDLSEEELYGLGENGSEIQYKKAEDEIIYMKNQMNILKEKNNFVNIINSNVNAIRSNTSSNKVNVNKKNNNDDNNMNNNNNNNTDNDTDDIKESKDKFEYSENEMRGAATSGFKGEEKLVMVRLAYCLHFYSISLLHIVVICSCYMLLFYLIVTHYYY